MSLRDDNIFIDSDLELIITTFEKAMIKSRNINSIYAGFRRDLEVTKNIPRSIGESIDKVPLPSQEEGTDEASIATKLPIPTELTGKYHGVTPSQEEASDEEETDKLKEWLEDCIPCNFRKYSSLDADFFLDIQDGWLDQIDKIEQYLYGLEDLFDDSNLVNTICSLTMDLNVHCPGDLKKILFVMNSLMEKIDLEFGLDLGVADSIVMSILQPLFNELLSNLDIIDEILLGPIKCIIDFTQYQVIEGTTNFVQNAGRSEFASGLISARERNRRGQEEAARTVAQSPTLSEADAAARRARKERAAETRRAERNRRVLGQVSRGLNRARQEIHVVDKFQDYLRAGENFLKGKKNRYLGMAQDLVDRGFDRWNKNLEWGKGKKDILEYVAILTTLIRSKVDPSARINCGVENSDNENAQEMEEENNTEALLRTVFRDFPAALGVEGELFIEPEDGDIITRREEPDAEMIIVSNVVARRPISSCLKKVTEDEIPMVEKWMSQLEG